jgi:hypothetical protein
MIRRGRQVLLAAVLVIPAALAIAGGVKVRTQYDKAFNFTPLKTFGWHPGGAGDVKLLVSDTGDAANIQRTLEPVIIEAVDNALKHRGLTKTEPGQGALQVNYYLLIGPKMSTQEMGQFVPGVPEWGLPGLSWGATTAYTAYVQGSLVVDISTPADGTVWRGIAEAEIDGKLSDEQRRQRIMDGVSRMLKDFPPKYKPK